MFRSLITNFLSFVFPDRCVGCLSPDTLICDKCLRKIDPPEDLPTNTIACFSYHDPIIKAALWRFKFKGRRAFADIFARVLHDTMLEELSDESLFGGKQSWVIVPVPLSPDRKRERGFNQSELVAQKLAVLLNIPAETRTLAKIKETVPQVSTRNREERLKNLLGAFWVCNPKEVQDKTIILVDDVTTTGATFREASRVLREAGARKIVKCAIAH